MDINLKKTKVMVLQNTSKLPNLDFFYRRQAYWSNKWMQLSRIKTVNFHLQPNSSVIRQCIWSLQNSKTHWLRNLIQKQHWKSSMALFLQYYSITLKFGEPVPTVISQSGTTRPLKKQRVILQAGEKLGKFPLIAHILKRLFKYIKNINEVPDDSIIKQMFSMSKRL